MPDRSGNSIGGSELDVREEAMPCDTLLHRLKCVRVSVWIGCDCRPDYILYATA